MTKGAGRYQKPAAESIAGFPDQSSTRNRQAFSGRESRFRGNALEGHERNQGSRQIAGRSHVGIPPNFRTRVRFFLECLTNKLSRMFWADTFDALSFNCDAFKNQWGPRSSHAGAWAVQRIVRRAILTARTVFLAGVRLSSKMT